MMIRRAYPIRARKQRSAAAPRSVHIHRRAAQREIPYQDLPE
jgi:hypothetical protein